MCAPVRQCCSNVEREVYLHAIQCQGVFMQPVLAALKCIKQVWGYKPDEDLVCHLDQLVYRCPRWLSGVCRCFLASFEARREDLPCYLITYLQELKRNYGPVILGMACSSLTNRGRRFLSISGLREALVFECEQAQKKLTDIFCCMRALALEARALSCDTDLSTACNPSQQFFYSVCLGSGVCRVSGTRAKKCLLQQIRSQCSDLKLVVASSSTRPTCSCYVHLFDSDEESCHRLLFLVLCAIKGEEYFS